MSVERQVPEQPGQGEPDGGLSLGWSVALLAALLGLGTVGWTVGGWIGIAFIVLQLAVVIAGFTASAVLNRRDRIRRDRTGQGSSP